jgi:hypothetical protein
MRLIKIEYKLYDTYREVFVHSGDDLLTIVGLFEDTKRIKSYKVWDLHVMARVAPIHYGYGVFRNGSCLNIWLTRKGVM